MGCIRRSSGLTASGLTGRPRFVSKLSASQEDKLLPPGVRCRHVTIMSLLTCIRIFFVNGQAFWSRLAVNLHIHHSVGTTCVNRTTLPLCWRSHSALFDLVVGLAAVPRFTVLIRFSKRPRQSIITRRDTTLALNVLFKTGFQKKQWAASARQPFWFVVPLKWNNVECRVF